MTETAHKRFRRLLEDDDLHILPAVFDAMTARLAEQAGMETVLVGGGLVANWCFGLPDIGLVTIPELVETARRVCAVVEIPVVLDVDDGGPTVAHVQRTVQLAEAAGVSCLMIEDTDSSRPKHLWNEERGNWDYEADVLRPLDEAADRISAAVHARRDADLVIMARTDACLKDAQGGWDEAVKRARAYARAGAELLLISLPPPGAFTRQVVDSLGAPVFHAVIDDVTKEERDTLARDGVKFLMHPWLAELACFFAFKEALEDLKSGAPYRFAQSQWDARASVLAALDLSGYSNVVRTQ